jgi:hypothetical protein
VARSIRSWQNGTPLTEPPLALGFGYCERFGVLRLCRSFVLVRLFTAFPFNLAVRKIPRPVPLFEDEDPSVTLVVLDGDRTIGGSLDPV